MVIRQFQRKACKLRCDEGIDISEEMLAVARKKAEGIKPIEFKRMDVYSLDFLDNHFDGVSSWPPSSS